MYCRIPGTYLCVIVNTERTSPAARGMRCLFLACLPCFSSEHDASEHDELRSPHVVSPLEAGRDVAYMRMESTDCTPANASAKSFLSPSATTDENTPPQPSSVDSAQRGLLSGTRYSPPAPENSMGVSFSSPLGMNSVW